MPAHGVAGGRTVLLEHRIGHAVGKAAIGVVVDLDELDRQVRLELIDDQSGAAIAGVHHDFERLELRTPDITE